MGEINVVPYIDVMLVLLIIFMVDRAAARAGREGGAAESLRRTVAAGCAGAARAVHRQAGPAVPRTSGDTPNVAISEDVLDARATASHAPEPRSGGAVEGGREHPVRTGRGCDGDPPACGREEGGLHHRSPSPRVSPMGATADSTAGAVAPVGAGGAPPPSRQPPPAPLQAEPPAMQARGVLPSR